MGPKPLPRLHSHHTPLQSSQGLGLPATGGSSQDAHCPVPGAPHGSTRPWGHLQGKAVPPTHTSSVRSLSRLPRQHDPRPPAPPPTLLESEAHPCSLLATAHTPSWDPSLPPPALTLPRTTVLWEPVRGGPSPPVCTGRDSPGRDRGPPLGPDQASEMLPQFPQAQV